MVFRSGDGMINALDGYCRHMGGDLTQGEVKGNEIACPFHDWRWGGDGRCKRVPYSKRVPKLARTAKWTTLEQDGMLFVWNDPEGNPPPPEVTIPRIEGATSDEWTDWHWYTTIVNTNCREIIDNVVDMAHFFYIHGSLPTQFKNIFEGHVATQYMNSAGRPDLGDTEGARMLGTTSVASYYGPSFMIDDLTYHYEDADHHTVLINCHYPIDANSFVLQYGIIVKKSDSLPDDLARRPPSAWATSSSWASSRTSRSGRPRRASTTRCWSRRTARSTSCAVGISSSTSMPPMCTPDMVDRFEFELDTTRPYETWMQDVEANMAAQTATTGSRDDAGFARPDRQPARHGAHGAGDVWQLRGAGAGAQEQLEPDQRAVEHRRVGAMPRASGRAENDRTRRRGVFLACSALSDSIVYAVRHGDLPIVDEIASTAT